MGARSRSVFLASLVPAVLLGGVIAVVQAQNAGAPAKATKWSDPATWPNNKVPAAGDKVAIAKDKNVILDVNTPALGGVTIDGQPDSPVNGKLDWESVDGPQGGLSISHTLTTDIGTLNSTSHYLDDSTPGAGAETQCTGDAQALGESGPWLNSTMPNTDPRTAPFNSLTSTRTLYFEAPGKADGAARATRAASQFSFTVSGAP